MLTSEQANRRADSRDASPLRYDRSAMDEALAAFRQYLTAEKRASAHTLRAYLHDLDELARLRHDGRSVTPRRSTSLTSSCAAPTLRRFMEPTTP